MEGRKARSSEKTAAKNQSERQQKEVRERAERDIDLVQADLRPVPRPDAEADRRRRESSGASSRIATATTSRAAWGPRRSRTSSRHLDLEAEAESLRDQIKTAKGQKRQRAIKRLKVVAPFTDETKKNSPMGMVLDCVPVIPPDLRPMVQLDGGRFATSRPERPLPAGHQPEQPSEEASRPRGSRDHRQQREAHAPGGRRRSVRQRPPRSSGHRPGQPSAQVALATC